MENAIGFSREVIMDDMKRFKDGMMSKYSLSGVLIIEKDVDGKMANMGYLFTYKGKNIEMTMPYVYLQNGTRDIKEKLWSLKINYKDIDKKFKTIGDVFKHLGA